nr:hypothetical protein [Staphylococcus epidermidis]
MSLESDVGGRRVGSVTLGGSGLVDVRNGYVGWWICKMRGCAAWNNRF